MLFNKKFNRNTFPDIDGFCNLSGKIDLIINGYGLRVLKMSLCKICKRSVFDGIYFSNGGMIHESCLESIQAKELEIKNEIYEQQRIINGLTRKIERRKGLIFKFVSIFSKPSSDLDDIEGEVIIAQENIKQLSIRLSPLKAIIALIYDYFLTYPPDWEERRKQVVERDSNQCSKCGEWGHLHLHHITPLSMGGSNKITNLKLLCENCHSKKHGGRDFSGDFNSIETAFSKRVANIRYAIEKGKRIKFGYKKPKEKSHKQRTVRPVKLVNLGHYRDSGSILCVRGYCELRKAERTFALKRMRGLKVDDRIQGVKPSLKSSASTNKFKKATSIKKKVKPKKKTQLEDMYDQLEQHDIENLKLMGYDRRKDT